VDRFPLVSVIIPVFNRFYEADRAIRSVLAQTWENWELFVVDDCSEKEYTLPDECNVNKQTIVLARNLENIGPGLSRQRGLENTCGEFVCFLDSDDYYGPYFLERSIHFLKTKVDHSASFANSEYVQTGMVRGVGIDLVDDIMPSLFKFDRPWATCSWLWRRKYLARWRHLRTNQDSLFEIDCSMINNKIIHIPEVLCFIDKGTGQNSSDLVTSVVSNKHRNYVARYAFANRGRIDFGNKDPELARKIILNRIGYTSIKMIHRSNFSDLLKSAVILICSFQINALSLILISFLCLFPSDRFSYLLSRFMGVFFLTRK
jgi:glycosyltransferase involved in cell wall biosynthesis